MRTYTVFLRSGKTRTVLADNFITHDGTERPSPVVLFVRNKDGDQPPVKVALYSIDEIVGVELSGFAEEPLEHS
jgi:hypothetical protein